MLSSVFLAWHIPLMYRTAAGQDEDWYAAPGTGILQTGLPHIPYITSNDPGSVCYHADVAIYTLPPLGFYFEALVQLFLGHGLGPARMASMLAGLGAVFLVYALGRLWCGDRRGALLGSTVYMVSRPFLFPATMARPDMVATALALLSVWWVARYGRTSRRRCVVASGVAAGLCLLTHPFGIVAASQVGLWLLLRPGRLAVRAGDGLIFAAAALVAFGLWLPLIARHPDIFQIQFGSNVIHRAGPGLEHTVIDPLPALSFQTRQLAMLLQPAQATLFAIGLLGSLIAALRAPGSVWDSVPGSAYRELAYHLWASLVLLLLFIGRHPVHAYYAYPGALASLAVGMLASDAAARLERWLAPFWPHCRAATTGLTLALLLAVLLPGAGLRTILTHLRHWNNSDYNVHLLTNKIVNDIPPDALIAVDKAYVLDFHLAGRRVMDALVAPENRLPMYDFRDRSFDYVVFSARSARDVRPLMDNLALVKTYGNRDDPMACYAELYRRIPASQRNIERVEPRSP